MGIKYKRMGNYTADEKRQLEEAVGRHRLYLLAKHDYKRFESCVGADKAAEVLCDLKRTHRADARLGRFAVREIYGRHKVLPGRRTIYHCKALNLILNDANAYAKGPEAQSPLRNMKLHLLWCFFSHILLLLVAGYFLMAPWTNGIETGSVNHTSLAEVFVLCLRTFLLLLWNIKKWGEVINSYTKPWLKSIVALILFIGIAQYVLSMPINESESQMLAAVGLGVVMLSIIWFILDCMAGLSPRRYFIGPEGIMRWFRGFFKGEFSLFSAFSSAISNSYDRMKNPEDYYRGAERSELERRLHKGHFLLSNSSGYLELHPSSSLKFIAAYVFTDIIHTGSIVAAMYGINTFLVKHSATYSLLAALIAFSLVCVLLEQPIIVTNNFNRYITKNLYAYRVSHLFRKLFFSVILLVFAGYMLQTA